MPISLFCPSCGVKLEAPEAAAGKLVTCTVCKANFVVPQNVASFALSKQPPIAALAFIAHRFWLICHNCLPESKFRD